MNRALYGAHAFLRAHLFDRTRYQLHAFLSHALSTARFFKSTLKIERTLSLASASLSARFLLSARFFEQTL